MDKGLNKSEFSYNLALKGLKIKKYEISSKISYIYIYTTFQDERKIELVCREKLARDMYKRIRGNISDKREMCCEI